MIFISSSTPHTLPAVAVQCHHISIHLRIYLLKEFIKYKRLIDLNPPFRKTEGFQYSNFLNVGALNQVIITTSRVIHPPNTTEGVTPISRAAIPLSN
jgi:hypothetical protein